MVDKSEWIGVEPLAHRPDFNLYDGLPPALAQALAEIMSPPPEELAPEETAPDHSRNRAQ